MLIALDDRQEQRLLRMTAALRDIPYLLEYVYQIKECVREGRTFDARALWSDLTEDEQIALWVAPRYGGIFTTTERKVLHHE